MKELQQTVVSIKRSIAKLATAAGARDADAQSVYTAGVALLEAEAVIATDELTVLCKKHRLPVTIPSIDEAELEAGVDADSGQAQAVTEPVVETVTPLDEAEPIVSKADSDVASATGASATVSEAATPTPAASEAPTGVEDAVVEAPIIKRSAECV